MRSCWLSDPVRKTTFALALLGLLAWTGCARHYNIPLNNGNVISSKGRPKFDSGEGAYVYKDENGQRKSIPAFRVREIAPQSGWTESSTSTAFPGQPVKK